MPDFFQTECEGVGIHESGKEWGLSLHVLWRTDCFDPVWEE